MIQCVDERMFTFLMEAFPAELTHERFVSRVDPYMSVERGASVKRFTTLVTFMRLFLQRENKGVKRLI